MKYGFIGLGVLGSRLAKNLLDANIDLTVYDLNNMAIQAAVKYGAIAGSSVSEVAAAVNVLITCLPSPEASAQVMEGDRGHWQRLNPVQPGSK